MATPKRKPRTSVKPNAEKGQIDRKYHFEPQGLTIQRYYASQERNILPKGNYYRRRQLNAIVHCPHDLDPNCVCVKDFEVDKSHPLTATEAKVGVASFRRSEMEKCEEQGRCKYSLLCKIIKCKEQKQDDHINQYESLYGPLLSNDVFDIDSSVAHLRPPAMMQNPIRAKVLDICQLNEPFRTLKWTPNSSLILASNDQYMFIHNASNVCLIDVKMKVIRQTEWPYGMIEDSSWNTKLNRIYITAKSIVFKMDPETMLYEQILAGDYYDMCTCSRDTLYLTTQPGRKVLALSLVDHLSLTSVFRSCENEFVEDISYNAGKLALVINSRNGTKPHVEILSTTNYALLFSVTITDAFGYNLCRISSLGSSGWLVKDPGTYNIHHITERNTLRMTPMYDYGHPYHACRFGAGYLVVMTGTAINLHKLKFVPIDDLTPSEVWDRCQPS